MAFDPELAAMYGRIGAHMAHAKHGGEKMTANARKGFMARFEREADPDGVLPAEERARRADHLRRAYMSRLALKRAEKRRAELEAA